ncbi:MAG: 3-isopropylmalate dehydrogenase [Liquorilactobacillus nagelii]|uniref:3-isopropylmalate dehydrogenase n=1 Tax=Liquorilactobacillus nagelii TaxID=82688 RepID=A0A3Q8CF93_9LACO|nr:3-isopropylmalate dehydrogenase [Liquorilactobacillus nagelii]AUJ31123.1 3-isopropylmalate dehydrogenase [Liquorilactobacillus nagelii]MCI1699036.1 3-isopropylmalate dehydrogenase [Liquorilactobacillus nagelii]MCP9315352.1 3-isopropylmalate dehydrogenase [Liquorilactobacillus nagelii]ULQ50553.1 3-isopropylmalate dehydrogenase [Liquorilactobacillus nagelii]
MVNTKNIAILRGDYIGPEIMDAGLAVLAAAAKKSSFSYQTIDYPFGGAAIDQTGTPLPIATIEGCQAADAVLLSAIGGPKWDQASKRPEAGLLEIRNKLGLFANIRPTKINSILAKRSPIKAEVIAGTDFVIVRELTSGIYFGKPRNQTATAAIDASTYTVEEIERIVRVGFKMSQHRKQHVTIVDKANVLATSKLWRQVAAKVAQDYPEITLDYCYVDAAAMKIISQPTFFDVIITANLFGDILSDEASVLTGSLGTIPSMSAGSTGPNLYEPIHGSAPDIAGKGIADPISMIQSIEMMLRESFQENQLADQIAQAVQKTIAAGILTPDLGGTATTQTVTTEIIRNLEG